MSNSNTPLLPQTDDQFMVDSNFEVLFQTTQPRIAPSSTAPNISRPLQTPTTLQSCEAFYRWRDTTYPALTRAGIHTKETRHSMVAHWEFIVDNHVGDNIIKQYAQLCNM